MLNLRLDINLSPRLSISDMRNPKIIITISLLSFYVVFTTASKISSIWCYFIFDPTPISFLFVTTILYHHDSTFFLSDLSNKESLLFYDWIRWAIFSIKITLLFRVVFFNFINIYIYIALPCSKSFWFLIIYMF